MPKIGVEIEIENIVKITCYAVNCQFNLAAHETRWCTCNLNQNKEFICWSWAKSEDEE